MTLNEYEASSVSLACAEYARDQEAKGFYATAAEHYRLAQRAARTASHGSLAIAYGCAALRCERMTRETMPTT